MTESDSLVPPTIEQMPLKEQSFVRLHSLQRATELNGRTGLIDHYYEDAGRFQVYLDGEKKKEKKNDDKKGGGKKKKPQVAKTILVKQENLERIPYEPLEVRQAAFELAQRAYPMLIDGSDDDRTAAKDMLNRALQMDQQCVLARALMSKLWFGSEWEWRNVPYAMAGCGAMRSYEMALAHVHAAAPFMAETAIAKLRIELANLYYRIHPNRYGQAEEQLEKVLEVYPDSFGANAVKAFIHSVRGEDEQANLVWDDIMDHDTDETGIHSIKEVAALKQDVLAYWYKRITTLPNQALPHYFRRTSHTRRSRVIDLKALALCERFLQSPDLSDDHRANGLSLKAGMLDRLRGSTDAAVVAIVDQLYTQARVVASFSTSCEASMILCKAFTEENRGDRAAARSDERFTHYQKALALCQESISMDSSQTCQNMMMRMEGKLLHG